MNTLVSRCHGDIHTAVNTSSCVPSVLSCLHRCIHLKLPLSSFCSPTNNNTDTFPEEHNCRSVFPRRNYVTLKAKKAAERLSGRYLVSKEKSTTSYGKGKLSPPINNSCAGCSSAFPCKHEAHGSPAHINIQEIQHINNST